MKKKLLNGYNLVINDEIDSLLNDYQSFYTPKYEDVFRAYKLTHFNDVKVLILGQDPYPTKGYADGLCFSVKEDKIIPKSLINIFKVLEEDTGIKKQSGDLSSWAEQGILLINCVLTNVIGETNAHKNIGWEDLTINVIKDLSNRGRVIFVLLGNYAQKYAKYINIDNNIILKTSHPSPLGCYRGFNDYHLFEKLNQSLKDYNYCEILY